MPYPPRLLRDSSERQSGLHRVLPRQPAHLLHRDPPHHPRVCDAPHHLQEYFHLLRHERDVSSPRHEIRVLLRLDQQSCALSIARLTVPTRIMALASFQAS
eukprot:2926481-Prymnesium_polylepis.1